MRDILSDSLKNLKRIRLHKQRRSAIVLVLSAVVSLNVFWGLRQPGLTLAGDAACGIQEHIHNDECYTRTLICELPEDAHVHTESCYTTRFTEQQEQLKLVCTQTEDPHVHGEACYATQLADAQKNLQLICAESTQSHIHTDICYELVTTDPIVETVLTCSLPETAHIHDDACYIQECHCELEEHIHSVDCYSDETADVETLLDWQNMFAGYPFTGDLREDLVGIAKTQVGYAESKRNFQIGDDGIRHGYTRYGAWYGTPYRDWSAAFVSFCLNYAEADPEQTPGNIGAKAMAEQWKNLGRFAPAGEYVPVAGDLVFFTNSTVGIITEVQNATFYAIRGDIDDAVRTDAIPLSDTSIAGWGVTAEEPTKEPSTPELTREEMLNVSNGPEFFIFANGGTPQQPQSFSLQNTRSDNDLLYHLTQQQGELSFKLYENNNLLQPDENNNYIVDPNTAYKLTLSIKSLNGIHPGTYVYQLPAGLTPDADNGTFLIIDQATDEPLDVGNWNVSKDGLITLVFNNNMAHISKVEIPATIRVYFDVQDNPISFDGIITVTVSPPDLTDPTVLSKWGSQGYEENTEGKTDPSKIYWSIKIEGKEDSQIPGSVLTDRIISGEWIADHRYTESDMAAGIRFDVQDPNGNWHRWTVMPSDPNLSWTETGWSYTIPESVTCNDGDVLTLGNENWQYLVNYTTTPDTSDHVGGLTYANQANVDEQSFDGYVKFQHGSIHGEIQKTGGFQADASGGSFRWEVSAVIPAMQAGQKANFWYISDYMSLYNKSGTWLRGITNDADKAVVTATYHDTTIDVPNVYAATDADTFAWYVSWSAETNGIYHGRTIDLLQRCACTAETCPWWTDAGCGSKPWLKDENGQAYLETTFCKCWTMHHPTTFTLNYQTDDLSIIEEYGGLGNQLRNYAELFYIANGNEQIPLSVDDSLANVTIPGLFKKKLTQEYDGYTAHYSITVNESKLSLTNGSALHIHDEMTDTLAFISGSLVMTAEDANQEITTLHQGTDFTVTYDGTGNKTDKNGNKVHILDITILHPQPVKYIIDYDATLIIPEQTQDGVKYSNSASITLWGKTIKEDTPEIPITEFGISGESYAVKVNKTSALTGDPLGDALFGLYNVHDGQITTATTGDDGFCFFRTNIIQGIIFREHELYYIQELQSPPGYQLDDTKHWFVFCNNTADTCEQCATLMGEQTAVRIPYNQVGPLNITNEIMNYDLPATGGPGIYPLILVSVLFITTPLVYASVQRHKRARKGTR